MIRVVDTRRLGDKRTIPGQFWTDVVPPNGFVWRIRSAIKHMWSMNGRYAKMNVPTREAMEKLGIAVPADWDGMRLGKGKIAEQWDDDGPDATMRLLVGGRSAVLRGLRSSFKRARAGMDREGSESAAHELDRCQITQSSDSASTAPE